MPKYVIDVKVRLTLDVKDDQDVDTLTSGICFTEIELSDNAELENFEVIEYKLINKTDE